MLQERTRKKNALGDRDGGVGRAFDVKVMGEEYQQTNSIHGNETCGDSYKRKRRLQVRSSWLLVGLCRVTGVTCQSEDPADTTVA